MRALWLLCWLFPALAWAQQSAEEQALAKETYVENLRLLPADAQQKAMGIRFAYVPEDAKPGGGSYFCGALASPRREEAAQELLEAFARLPLAVWESVGLQTVLLCETAQADHRPIGGIPVPPLKLLMIAVGVDRAVSPRLGVTGMHELYHFIEFQHGGMNDAEWDVRFGGYDGTYGVGTLSTVLGSGGPGFINAYGKSYAREERAELFGLLNVEPGEVLEHLRAKRDILLEKKIVFLTGKCRKMLGEAACR